MYVYIYSVLKLARRALLKLFRSAWSLFWRDLTLPFDLEIFQPALPLFILLSLETHLSPFRWLLLRFFIEVCMRVHPMHSGREYFLFRRVFARSHPVAPILAHKVTSIFRDHQLHLIVSLSINVSHPNLTLRKKHLVLSSALIPQVVNFSLRTTLSKSYFSKSRSRPVRSIWLSLISGKL